MKLTKRKMLLVSFMLFSLFFGAGNLIFPPFLGQMAGSKTPVALLGFLVTAVVLPVMGVLVVAKFNGLQKLAGKVDSRFAVFFTVLIYLAIGPGLGIPRAASVPFEMAIAPYLPENLVSYAPWFMLLYSLLFFAVAMWLALSPKKLVDRIGKFLTPTLLTLLVVLFVSFLVAGKAEVAAPQGAYQNAALATGFLEGYNTMDAIAALNFGLVIATTLGTLGVDDKKSMMRYTLKAGLVAGTILATVYGMLTYLGMKTSAVYSLEGNGAWTLRCIVQQVFGKPGAVLLALTFTVACLTTCVGLITSISQYFASLVKKVSYKKWVVLVTVFSFAVCNQGLNAILGLSVPVLNAVYPVAIVLIVLGLCDKWLEGNKVVYPLTVAATGVVSLLHAAEGVAVGAGHSFGAFGEALATYLPLYKDGLGWVLVALVAAVLSVVGVKVWNMAHAQKAEAKSEKASAKV